MADDEKLEGATGGGLLASMVGVLAAALVLALPLVSAILFGLAGVLSFAAAAAGYGNHWVYGSDFMALGVVAFFGWIGKRKNRRESAAERQRQIDRDDRLETLLRQQRDQVQYPTEASTGTGGPPKATFPNFCPSCKHRNEQGVKFCAECGTALSPVASASASE